MIGATIMGCGKAKPEITKEKSGAIVPPVSPKELPKKKQEPIAVALGQGKSNRVEFWTYQKLWFTTFRADLWFIEWQSANLALINGKQSGFMFKVHGNVFEKNQPAGEFFADHAEADRAVDRLILEGGIKIKSGKSIMTAKKVEWLAGNEVFKASGEVFLEGPDGSIGPVDVLFASAKLNKVASSLQYFKK